MKRIVLILATVSAIGANAITKEWKVEQESFDLQIFDAYHNEDITFSPLLYKNGVAVAPYTGMTATLYWQTEDMNDEWWTTNNVTVGTTSITVPFTKEMDPGTDFVRFFLRCVKSGEQDYRANWAIRFHESPGLDPTITVIPPPSRTLDFATCIISNAPYYTKAEVDYLMSTNAIIIDFDTKLTRAASDATNHADTTTSAALSEVSGKYWPRDMANDGTRTALTIGTRKTGTFTKHGTLAQGFNVEASGEYAEAQGNNTKASGYGSHAEGGNTYAAGLYSHAEGRATGAIAEASHAEGIGSIARATGSHAEGYYAFITNDHESAWTWNGDNTVAGRYYDSKGKGTFAINPIGGTSGFWIGSKTLATIIGESIGGTVSVGTITNDVKIASGLITKLQIGDAYAPISTNHVEITSDGTIKLVTPILDRTLKLPLKNGTLATVDDVARGIDLSDAGLSCEWKLSVTNGVFIWTVRP